MFARLLIILLIALAVYLVLARLWGSSGARAGAAWARDPRVRAAAAGIGILALRTLLQRAWPGFGRWLSVLRWFR